MHTAHVLSTKNIKISLNLKKYLSILPERTKIQLTKFRTNNSKLPIVTDRCVGRNGELTPWENRYCILCDSHDAGDEFHLLYKCTHDSIVESRSNFLKLYCNRP